MIEKRMEREEVLLRRIEEKDRLIE